jgi:hypothetical protein
MAKRQTTRKRSQPEALQRVPDRLPAAPEPGDAADRAQQSEPIVSPLPTESESMASEPSEEEIRLRAYHRFLRRGGEHGGHFDDWIEAENELKKK